ncbi:MAG: CCA tRNA nucleotidyltransferase [Candidatus Diapherotrites archaeon]|uniref:CCA-adding enzyme n=1 Tax=Candidatus Iainarchaeum sp. TaxID=3101447 RepID=A0A7J4KUH0_9ARCH|nr:CCA tRNA nucleotidyltransferase [Candidatus Diapherotrites archaeon]HIH33572.1 CCA tRNA nucleotidyltransferase [Candidatus Diapherotrites archaeon]
MPSLEKILQSVLETVKPSEQEFRKEMEKAEELIKRIYKLEGKHVKAVLGGSLARSTHLKGDRDIDIFVLFPSHLSRQEFKKEGLRIGKQVFNAGKFEIAFSEHPYVRGIIDGFDIEIVPGFDIKETSLLQSSVDRSSFHTAYLQKKLSSAQQDEVRLLKQFLKGIQCYGADLRQASFSGYLTELLILKYGNFLECLKAVAEWKKPTVIDLENYWLEEQALEKFRDFPLIIIDSTDRSRNAAAAVSLQQMARFTAASRTFLKKPSMNFFFPPKTKPLQLKKVSMHVQKEGLIVLEMPYPKGLLADIFWGMIKRLARKLHSALEEKEFKVLRSEAWTDEKSLATITIDLQANALEQAFKRIGPEVFQKQASENFLKAHKKPLSGPRIENGRWIVEELREHYLATEFLKFLLKKLSKEEVKELRFLLKKARVLNQKQILKLYKKSPEFQEHFTRFLKGKEEFLEY